MAEIADMQRVEVLSGKISGSAGVALTPAKVARRVSLRLDPGDAAAASKVLGVDLPLKPKTSANNGKGRWVLWIGPDEWLIIDETGDPAADLARLKVLNSAVDVSHRNTAIIVTGKGARATLEGGCPQDLTPTVFPVGACSRTVLGKIEVVILRTGESAYRVECWRSFSDYAFALLSDCARDCLA